VTDSSVAAPELPEAFAVAFLGRIAQVGREASGGARSGDGTTARSWGIMALPFLR
jgi:hypothetical protein